MEKAFYEAAHAGNVMEAINVLRNNPSLDVNWMRLRGGERSFGIFFDAAIHTSSDAIISILLAHPDIDVNRQNESGRTTFMIACLNESISCIRVLLTDARVKVSEPDLEGSTPLCCAARSGYLDAIKWWIASGREMDLGTPGNEKTDAVGEAKEKGKTSVVTLLERFKENQVRTRIEIMAELGITGEAASILELHMYVWPGFESILSIRLFSDDPAIADVRGVHLLS